jgi:cation/acetate symporter
VRALASLSTLVVSTFYMIAQMVGAGALVTILFRGISYNLAVTGVGILMVVYVVFGGMLATTWVQITKAILLMGGTILLSILVLAHFGFDFGAFFNAVGHVTYTQNGQTVVQDFMKPGLRFKPPYGALDLISLGMALIFGTAGLPHILVRFYTVPDARTARISVVWAMGLIGSFYIMTTFLGFGAATIVGRDVIAANGGTNMSAPLLARQLGGEIFFGFISAIAFATILAVVAGLTISASTSFAHDFYTNVIHHGRLKRPQDEVFVARAAAFVVGAVAILIAILLGPAANVAFLVALAFAVAASANLPVIVLSLFWRRFNTAGAVTGLAAGLAASLTLILVSPSIMGTRALFPLENPGIVSIPVGFLGAIAATLLTREPAAEQKFDELTIRANTGLGAEGPSI